MSKGFIPPRRPEEFSEQDIFNYLHQHDLDGLTTSQVAQIMANAERYENDPRVLNSKGLFVEARTNPAKRN